MISWPVKGIFPSSIFNEIAPAGARGRAAARRGAHAQEPETAVSETASWAGLASPSHRARPAQALKALQTTLSSWYLQT